MQYHCLSIVCDRIFSINANSVICTRRVIIVGKNSWERARDSSDEFNHRNRQSSADFNRRARQAHGTAHEQSVLGSGRSETPEPAQAGGGTLELLSMTMVGVVTSLGALAAAELVSRARR